MSTLIGRYASETLADTSFFPADADSDIDSPSTPTTDSPLPEDGPETQVLDVKTQAAVEEMPCLDDSGMLPDVQDVNTTVAPLQPDTITPATPPTVAVVIPDIIIAPLHRESSPPPPPPPPPPFFPLPPTQLNPAVNAADVPLPDDNPADIPLPDDLDTELDEVARPSCNNTSLLLATSESSVVYDPAPTVTSPSPFINDTVEPLVGLQLIVDESPVPPQLPTDEPIADSSLDGDLGRQPQPFLLADPQESQIAQAEVPAVTSPTEEIPPIALDGSLAQEASGDGPISPAEPTAEPVKEKKVKRSRPHTRNKGRRAPPSQDQTRIKNASVPGSEEWLADEESRRLQRQQSSVGVAAPLTGLLERPSVMAMASSSSTGPRPTLTTSRGANPSASSFDLLMERINAQRSAIRALQTEPRMETPGAGPSSTRRTLPTFASLAPEQRAIASGPFTGRVDDVSIYPYSV